MKTLIAIALFTLIDGRTLQAEGPPCSPLPGLENTDGAKPSSAIPVMAPLEALDQEAPTVCSNPEERWSDAYPPGAPEVRFGMYTDGPRIAAGDPPPIFFDQDLARLDTTEGAPVHPKPKLLPDNMSLMERSLWGEGGIIRWIGIASPLTPEVRKSELSVRRTMLSIHQVGGFVTLGLMITAAYYGQKYLNNSLSSDRKMHQTFVTATIASYSLTGLLAILSPPPMIRRDETSTTTIHKTLAWVHFVGMIATPIIGNMVRKRSGRYSYTDLSTAHFHQVAAYITTGVFAASLIVITF